MDAQTHLLPPDATNESTDHSQTPQNFTLHNTDLKNNALHTDPVEHTHPIEHTNPVADHEPHADNAPEDQTALHNVGQHSAPPDPRTMCESHKLPANQVASSQNTPIDILAHIQHDFLTLHSHAQTNIHHFQQLHESSLTEYNALHEENKALMRHIQHLTVTVSDLQSSVQHLHHQSTTLSTSHAEIVQRYETRCLHLLILVSALTKELEQNNAQIRAHQLAQDERNELRMLELHQSTQQMQHLEAQINALQSRLNDTQQHLEHTLTENEQMALTIYQLQHSLHDAQQKLLELSREKELKSQSILEEETLKRQNLEQELTRQENTKLTRFEHLLQQMQRDLSVKEKQLEEHEARERLQEETSRKLEQNLRETEHTLRTITKQHNLALEQFQERTRRADEELEQLRHRKSGTPEGRSSSSDSASSQGPQHHFPLSAKLQAIERKLNMATRRTQSSFSKSDQLVNENRDLRKILLSLEESIEFLQMDLKRSTMRIEELENISNHEGNIELKQHSRKSAYYQLREELEHTKRKLHALQHERKDAHDQLADKTAYDELRKEWIRQNHLLDELKRSETYEKFLLLRDNKVLIYKHEKQKSAMEKLQSTVEEQQRIIAQLQRQHGVPREIIGSVSSLRW